MKRKTSMPLRSEGLVENRDRKQKEGPLKKMESLVVVQEEWRQIIGFEGRYEISNYGRVKSLVIRLKCGWKIRKLSKHRGYNLLTLKKNGKSYRKSCSRMILESFIGTPRNPIMQAAHLNNIPLDNRLKNLKWCTPQENSDHKKIFGTELKGSRNGMSTINEDTAIKIYKDSLKINLNKRGSAAVLAKKYNVTRSIIFHIAKKRRWKHVTCL